MSVATLPILAGPTTGLGWSVTRQPQWDTSKAVSISGKETRVSNWSYPRYQWTITYNLLRQGTVLGSDWDEMAQLFGFYNARQGSFDSWLYQDAHDDTVTGQTVGTGDGATAAFQMIRAFGGFVEPILAPDLSATLNVYLNGVLQSPSSYTVTAWETTNAAGPGKLIFNSAPGAGVAITVDFSWFWPVRFDADKLSFDEFMAGLFELKTITFTSLK